MRFRRCRDGSRVGVGALLDVSDLLELRGFEAPLALRTSTTEVGRSAPQEAPCRFLAVAEVLTFAGSG